MYANDVMPDLVDSKTITLKTIRHIFICLKVGGCLKIATLMGIGMTNRLIMKFFAVPDPVPCFQTNPDCINT